MTSSLQNFPAVVAHRLDASGAIPNHPRWPLLIYPGAVAIGGADPAAAFEDLFTRNGWPAAWRNGIYPFHHFHCDAHEALGVYSGEVTAQFGGDGGIVITARPGDVIVLPAGTGHKKLSSRGALGIVGAYPAGQSPDMATPLLSNMKRELRQPSRAWRCRRAIRSMARAGRCSRTGAESRDPPSQAHGAVADRRRQRSPMT